jgi:hypothetical protein
MFLRDLEINYLVSDKSNTAVLKLVEDPEFMLLYNVLSLAKNHNYFS